MTKQEYIKSRCEACGLCDGSEYHQNHCPDVDEIDSAWEICQKKMIDKLKDIMNRLMLDTKDKAEIIKAMEEEL